MVKSGKCEELGIFSVEKSMPTSLRGKGLEAVTIEDLPSQMKIDVVITKNLTTIIDQMGKAIDATKNPVEKNSLKIREWEQLTHVSTESGKRSWANEVEEEYEAGNSIKSSI